MTISLLTAQGCKTLFGDIAKRTVTVPPLLKPLQTATSDQLIAEVNRVAAVRSLRGRVDIEFQDTSFSEFGINDKYRTAEGSVIVQRPGQVYLEVNGPFGVEIARMTSDGEHFRVAVLKGDDKYRRFVKGTNNARYQTFEMGDGEAARDKEKMSEQRAVSALSNLRPQHLTDALLVRPIMLEKNVLPKVVYTQSEFYEEEAAPNTGDKQARSNKTGRVVRGYYFLDEIVEATDGRAHLTRRFWFDRVNGIRFARMQTFDEQGDLVTDVTYSNTKPFGEGARVNLPSRIELSRPHDGYKLALTYQSPEEAIVDRQYQPDIFILENKWQLREVDLDERQKK
ncbi:MAG: hypothetical protein ICV60_01020 [Pyrinomonadaceae bacterium]|nr:hypothetical protein [Pyrinomonadaceae bacterium]